MQTRVAAPPSEVHARGGVSREWSNLPPVEARRRSARRHGPCPCPSRPATRPATPAAPTRRRRGRWLRDARARARSRCASSQTRRPRPAQSTDCGDAEIVPSCARARVVQRRRRAWPVGQRSRARRSRCESNAPVARARARARARHNERDHTRSGGIALLRCGVRARAASSAPLGRRGRRASALLCALRARSAWPLPVRVRASSAGRPAGARWWSFSRSCARGASGGRFAGAGCERRAEALPRGGGGATRRAGRGQLRRDARNALVKLLADEPANDDAPPATGFAASRLARAPTAGRRMRTPVRGVPARRGRRRARGVRRPVRFGVGTRAQRAPRAALTGSATAAWARRPQQRPPLTRRPSTRTRRARIRRRHRRPRYRPSPPRRGRRAPSASPPSSPTRRQRRAGHRAALALRRRRPARARQPCDIARLRRSLAREERLVALARWDVARALAPHVAHGGHAPAVAPDEAARGRDAGWRPLRRPGICCATRRAPSRRAARGRATTTSWRPDRTRAPRRASRARRAGARVTARALLRRPRGALARRPRAARRPPGVGGEGGATGTRQWRSRGRASAALDDCGAVPRRARPPAPGPLVARLRADAARPCAYGAQAKTTCCSARPPRTPTPMTRCHRARRPPRAVVVQQPEGGAPVRFGACCGAGARASASAAHRREFALAARAARDAATLAARVPRRPACGGHRRGRRARGRRSRRSRPRRFAAALGALRLRWHVGRGRGRGRRRRRRRRRGRGGLARRALRQVRCRGARRRRTPVDGARS